MYEDPKCIEQETNNHMTEIRVYIILPNKIGELHTEPVWTKQNISCHMEVSSPRKFPMCTAEVLRMLLSERPWRN